MVSLVSRMKKHIQKCSPSRTLQDSQRSEEQDNFSDEYSDSTDDLPLAKIRDKAKSKRQKIVRDEGKWHYTVIYFYNFELS